MTQGRALDRRVLVALAIALIGVVVLAGCGESTGAAESSAAPLATPTSADSPTATPKVTFVELGSDKCIPCKEMRPVMDAIERTFGGQVKVVFYDVWEDEAPAREYGIQMIPTQVFLDDKGVEFHRHTGFYPQETIEALLIERGLKKIATP